MNPFGGGWNHQAVSRKLRTGTLRKLLPSHLRSLYWRILALLPKHAINGLTMVLPPDQRTPIHLSGQYEKETFELLGHLLRPGMTFVDVGANVGFYTLFASQAVGPNGKVLSIEPLASVRKYLERNVEDNYLTNVVIIDKMIMSRSGNQQLFLSNYSGSHSAYPDPANKTGTMIQVEAAPLHEVLGCQEVDVLKVDVEGAELEVLQSLGPVRPSCILFEYNSERSRAAGHGWDDLVRWCLEAGYESVEPIGVSLEGDFEGTMNALAIRPGVRG